MIGKGKDMPIVLFHQIGRQNPALVPRCPEDAQPSCLLHWEMHHNCVAARERVMKPKEMRHVESNFSTNRTANFGSLRPGLRIPTDFVPNTASDDGFGLFHEKRVVTIQSTLSKPLGTSFRLHSPSPQRKEGSRRNVNVLLERSHIHPHCSPIYQRYSLKSSVREGA